MCARALLFIMCLGVFSKLCGADRQGPVLIHEPPNRVEFANSTGSVIPCSAHGVPAPVISWVVDGVPVVDVAGLRHVRPDGSLVFTPFRAEDFRQDVHDATYRCRASNGIGMVGSRDVRVRGVVLQNYLVEVYDEYVISGNTAVLRCHVPGFVKEFLTVTSWIQDGSFAIPATALSGDRFSIFPSGELHIRRVDASDGQKKFQCQTRHQLTGEIVTSSTSGRIVVTEPFSNVLPRITDSRRQIVARLGQTLEVPCAAQGHPAPTYRWLRKSGARLHPLKLDQRMTQLDGTLVIQHLTTDDTGKYVCMVNNSMGSDSVTCDLLVKAPLTVRVEPKQQTVDVGKSAILNCSYFGHPVHSVEWFRNQNPLPSGARMKNPTRNTLVLKTVQRDDMGMYQCYVFNEDESAQGSAQISLGEDAPTLLEVFQGQTLEPGPSLSLKCVASGNPLPQVTWTLDGAPVPEGSRFRMGDYVKSDATVVSYVNVTHVLHEDGGTYSCSAANDVGTVRHHGRVHVYGPPFIRPMKNRTVVAGEVTRMQCPVGGYPIEAITWSREGLRLPYNHRQQVFPNGTLSVQDVERATDEGRYSCTARNSEGQVAQNSLYISVIVKPFIEPFVFPKSLHQGQRYTVLCSVVKGDPPVTIGWLKDGQRIGEGVSSGVHAVEVTHFSSTLVFESLRPDHRGNYTCLAENDGGTTSHTATMVIHVPPRWRIEPIDSFVVRGQNLILDCQAEGFPLPRIRWSKAQGELASDFKPISSSSHLHVFENGSLAIQNAGSDDSGNYLCQATNGIGQGLSKVIQLAVRVAVHFGSKFSAETVRKGHDAKLKCEALGDKPITIALLKDKQPFDPLTDPRYEVRETVFSSGVTLEIVIHRADRRDSALFTCVGTNAFGKDDTNLQLIMQEPPDYPQDFRVMELSSRSVRMTWSPPYSGNSPILEYIVQYKSEKEKWHQRVFNVSISGAESTVVIKGLFPVTSYTFRVAAINSLGRSDPSATVSVRTEEEAPGGPPLKVKGHATGSQSVKVFWKAPLKDLHFGEIRGYYVGYKMAGSTDTYVYKTLDSDKDEVQCQLFNLRRKTKYGVVIQAFNSKGAGPPSDEVLIETLQNDPPRSPSLQLLSSTPSSLRIGWVVDKTDSNPVTGYILYYKKDGEPWAEIKLPFDAKQYSLNHLKCGSSYHFYITAFNAVGKGDPGDILVAKTDGMAPVAPDKQSFLQINASSVGLRLDTWHDGGCPLAPFSVKYRLQRHDTWTVVSNNVSPGGTNQAPFEVTGLTVGTWYQLQVTGHNDAGGTEAVYSFATLSRGRDSSLTVQESPATPLYLDLNVILPAVVSFVVVIAVITLVCAIVRKRHASESAHNSTMYATRKSQPRESVHLSDMDKNVKKPVPSHRGTPLYYPTPYATTDITGTPDSQKMLDGSSKQLLQDEPLYATVKRTPRPPRSDFHIYHYPDDLTSPCSEWKLPPSLCLQDDHVDPILSASMKHGGSRKIKYSAR